MQLANNVTVIPPEYARMMYGGSGLPDIAPESEQFLEVMPEERKLRVAAYARVSTAFEEQESSYEIQVQHYTNYIKGNKDWIFAGVYADDGISATNTAKRDAFNTMIEDCRAGKIDLILTKSISRFSRNTMDCLQYTRELKKMDVGVIFEKENINTLESSGEVLLTILASLAQQESESLSQNIRLGIKYRNEAGKVQVNHNRFLGYTKDENGKLIVDPAEAKVVKRIYAEYLNGASILQIKRGLEADGILNGAHNSRWHESNIRQILSNEKYIGDAVLQKTFTKDLLEKKRVKNDGKMAPMYYVTGSHEAIIDKDVFARVQAELSRRANLSKNGKRRVYSCKYALSSIVVCAHCGDLFRRFIWRRSGYSYVVWRCMSRMNNEELCSARTIREEELQAAVVTAVNDLLGGRKTVIEELKRNATAAVRENAEKRLRKVEAELIRRQQELVKKSEDDDTNIEEEISRLRKEKMELLDRISSQKSLQNRITELVDFLDSQTTALNEYSEDLVRRFIDRVVVFDEKIEVEFKSGIKVEVDG